MSQELYFLLRFCICQISSEKQNQQNVYIGRKGFIIRSWLTGLWRLTNPKTSVSKLEAPEGRQYNSLASRLKTKEESS